MIDKAYWNKIAAEWKKIDDGIDIPKPGTDPDGVSFIDPDEDKGISSTEIDDILSDLGLDDI